MHYHPITGDIIYCKGVNFGTCQNPAKYFIGGLYPICEEHSKLLRNPKMITWEEKIKVFKTKMN